MEYARGSYRLLSEDRQSEDSEKLNHDYSLQTSWPRTALLSSLAAILFLSLFFNVLLVFQSVSLPQPLGTSQALDDAPLKGPYQQTTEESRSLYGVYINYKIIEIELTVAMKLVLPEISQ